MCNVLIGAAPWFIPFARPPPFAGRETQLAQLRAHISSAGEATRNIRPRWLWKDGACSGSGAPPTGSILLPRDTQQFTISKMGRESRRVIEIPLVPARSRLVSRLYIFFEIGRAHV